MKQLRIEWRHLGDRGATCARCSATGRTLDQVIASLRDELAPEGVELTFVETPLSADLVAESNSLLFNGEPLERVLSDVRASENYCGSCSALTQQETYCGTLEHDGQVYEEVPAALVRQAALAAVSKEQY